MKFKIIAVGKKMPAWVTETYQEYTKRFFNNYHVELIEITAKIDMEKESELILSKIEPTDYVIALDEHGKMLTSKALSDSLQTWHDENLTVAILIGGADGLAKSCKQRANMMLSLSSLTLPHPLVRVVLVEQLYRAMTIINNHPYHRE
jgi:23S rRNA (pseudouridine1915-N3)-methyltransferase